jgi:hypothetical protein
MHGQPIIKIYISGHFVMEWPKQNSQIIGLGSLLKGQNTSLNCLKPTGYVMHHQFNIQQLYILLTLYLSENKQRLVPLTA